MHIIFKFILIINIFFMLIPSSVNAKPIDWEGYADKVVKKGSPEEEKLKKAQKKAKKQEDKFKKIIDKEFKDSFKKVFKDRIKPSQAYDLIKVFEALSAGDYEPAGKDATALLIATYTPLLGTYVSVMKASSAIIKDQIDTWSKEVYNESTYKIAKQIFMKESRKYPSYVPSYMMTYVRNNKVIGKDMQKVWDNMKKREDDMFTLWSSGTVKNEEALDEFLYGNHYGTKSMKDIINKGWSSRLRAITGKDPTNRQVFNHFLHHFATQKKRYYFEELQYEYIEPLMKKELKKQKKEMDLATSQAITNALKKMKKESKKKKVVFFSSGGDENSFRQGMKKEQENDTQRDNRAVNQSYSIESQKHAQGRRQFRQGMQELAGSLQEVQTEMIISQAEQDRNKRIARDNRFEERKRDFRESNQAKYNARLGKDNNTVSQREKTIVRPKVSNNLKNDDETVCGYDVSINGNYIIEADYKKQINSKSKIQNKPIQQYKFYDLSTCRIFSERKYIGNGKFDGKVYAENGNLLSRYIRAWNKDKLECVVLAEAYNKDGSLKFRDKFSSTYNDGCNKYK